jgi:hypothetical protein
MFQPSVHIKLSLLSIDTTFWCHVSYLRNGFLKIKKPGTAVSDKLLIACLAVDCTLFFFYLNGIKSREVYEY